MECARCGYVMQEYEKECPRCSRMGARQPAGMPGRPQPAGVAGGVATAPRYLSRPDDDDYDDAPALGWPLTVMLWTVLLMSIAELLFIVIGLYIATGSIILVGFALAFFFTPVLKVAGIISLLREQRWGLFVYSFTCVVPAIMNLMMPPTSGVNGGGTLGFLILLVVDILPAIVIFYLAMTKWEVLE